MIFRILLTNYNHAYLKKCKLFIYNLLLKQNKLLSYYRFLNLNYFII